MFNFGAMAPTPAATSTAAPAVSLPAFGVTAASTAAPAVAPANPSPFGALATPASSAPATTAAAAPAFSAFGAPAATTSSSTTPLFGAPAATTTAAPASSLFGATITTAPATTAAPALGGFGTLPTSTTAAATTAAASPFGGLTTTTTTAAPSAFGGLTTATTAAATAAQPPQPLTLKTKYADMTPDQQKALTEIGTLIYDQIHMADQLQSQEVGEFIDTLTNDVSRLRKCYGNIATMLDRDMATIQTLRSSVRTELNRVEVAGRILDAVKKGTTAEIAYNRTYSIVRYFTEKEGEFRTRAADYAQRLAEIEDHVASLARSQPPSPQAVAETIRAQNNSFLLLASQVAALHNQVEKLRDQYLVYRRQYHGDGKNPFSKAGKKKKRVSSVVAAEDAEFSYKEYANQFVEPTSVTVVAAAPAAPPAAAAPAASMFGGSIFGTPKPATTAATTATPAPAFGASFGMSTFGQPESNKRQATGGLFGSTPTPAPAPAAPASGGFGGFSFGPK